MWPSTTARLIAGAALDFTRQNVGYAAQFGVPELVLAHILQHRGALAAIGARGKLRSFRHHDDGKILSAFVALPDLVRDFVDIKGPFGDQNDVRASRDSAVKGDPARIAAHH